MVTSGLTPASTTGATPVPLIPAQAGGSFVGGSIVNGGTQPIGWTLDGAAAADNQWAYLDPTASDNLPAGSYAKGLFIKAATGSDGSGISAKIY